MENQVPAAPQKNGLAIAGLVCGIIGLVFAWIPIVNFLSWILGGLALIFGIIAVIGKKPKKGAAIASIILGVLCFVCYYICYAVIAAKAESAATDYLNNFLQ